MRQILKFLSLNLAVGLGYMVAGWFGTLLATPPSNASPIWPAAGVALAVILTYGKAVLPGLFLGALAIQVYAFFDAGSVAKIIESLAIGGLVSIGACLQSVLGAWMIERWIGRSDPLIADQKIARFFILAALSCVVSASVGVGLLYVRDVISFADSAGSWVTWWIGDAIGAVVFTPMLLLFIGKPRLSWRARRGFVLYPLLIALAAVLASFEYAQRQEQARIISQFDRQVELLHSAIQEHLRDHLAANAATKALFDSSEIIGSREFATFASSIVNSHGGLLALEWTPRILKAELKQWQQKHGGQIRQRFPDGRLLAANEQDVYYPITFLLPEQGNERAKGYDISSNPQVAPILEQVIASGGTAVTPGIQLIQDSDASRLGNVIYAPVYAKLVSLETVEQRRRAFVGFVASVFRVGDDVDHILAWLGHKELQLLVEVYDDQQQRIYSNLPANYHQSLSFSPLKKFDNIDFAGRSWSLQYRPSAEFYRQQQSAFLAFLLLGGFLLCGLTGFSLLLLTGRTARVEELVARRTHDLMLSNQALNQEVALRQIQENELRVAATTFESHDAIVVTDADSSILRVNKAFTLITGYSAEEVIGQNPRILSSGYHDVGFYRNMYQALAKDNQWQGEIWNRRKNGEIFPEWLTLTGVRNHQNKLTHYVAIFSDVSQQRAAEREIQKLAFFDPLTNLPNRRLLLDRLKQEIAAAKRQHSYGALFFLDLDHFKTLNDSRGHQVGDELLIQVAQRLQSIIRDEDTACRLGGDEFIVMVPGRYRQLQQATNHAAMLAEKILMAINQPFIVQGSEHHFSTSIGVSMYPEMVDLPEDVIQQADTAMYRAKESGRNAISFYRRSMQEAADRRLTLEKEIRRALNQNQFVLHYQPQVNELGQLVSAEALIRWQHPQKGMIPPSEFIRVAEDTQLILPIGAWVLNAACQQIKAWEDQGKRINHVAVNVSSRQFRQSNFVQQVSQALQDNGLTAERLVIELTEGSVIDDIDDTIAKMRALQAMGIKISIDDFGIGYSSLSYLKSLPLSQLKIDQSFVRHIGDNNAAVIVETIIIMAKSLGLNVIAEGVENQQQMDFLRDKGCLAYQGYYFSRPVAAEAFRFND